MDTGSTFPDYYVGVYTGRIRDSHALIGLGGLYGVCVMNGSAKKSRIYVEGIVPVP